MKANASRTTTKKLLFTVAFSGLLFTNSTLMAQDQLVKDQLVKDKVLATVNGDNITESQLEIAATQSKVNFKEITPVQKK